MGLRTIWRSVAMPLPSLRRPDQVDVGIHHLRFLRPADGEQDDERIALVDQLVAIAVVLRKDGDVAGRDITKK